MIALDPLLQVLGDVMQRVLRQEPLFPGGRYGGRIGVAARNDERPDAQSRAVSGAD